MAHWPVSVHRVWHKSSIESKPVQNLPFNQTSGALCVCYSTQYTSTAHSHLFVCCICLLVSLFSVCCIFISFSCGIVAMMLSYMYDIIHFGVSRVNKKCNLRRLYATGFSNTSFEWLCPIFFREHIETDETFKILGTTIRMHRQLNSRFYAIFLLLKKMASNS